ncbi:MAG: hypothetical protein K5931_11030 [Lachnospiraceae bacterium]|nr:hypothetical protein [Lachnospiraceae bacterium]
MKKGFVKRILGVSLCLAMTAETLMPQAGVLTAYGFEPDRGLEASTIDEEMVEEDAKEVLESDEEALKEFFNEEEPTAEEIEAEKAEKAEYDRLVHENDLDDSYKLSDDTDRVRSFGEEEIQSEADEIESVGSSYSSEFDYVINGQTYRGTLDKAVANAIAAGKPLEMKSDVRVLKTITVEGSGKGKVLDLRANGHNIQGASDLGSNEIFKVKADTTLRISKGQLSGGGDGAIIADGNSSVELLDMLLSGNKAKRNGGALYLGKNVRCVLYGSQFKGNNAGRNGGAIFVNGSNVNIYMDSKSRFEGNQAENNGGAIYVDNTKVNLYGPTSSFATMVNNRASGHGGTIFANKDDCSFYNISITDSISSKDGGGIYIDGASNTFSGLQVWRCASLSSGGGVYINGEKSSFSNIDVRACEAKKYGGGIYLDSRYNIGTGGKMYIYENKCSTDKSANNLFLQKGKTTRAFIKLATYTPGSKVGIFADQPADGRRLSYEPANCNPTYYVSDNGDYYICYINDRKSPGNRSLFLTKDKNTAMVATVSDLKGRSENKRKTTELSYKYSADNGGEYPVCSGYFSTPSMTDETKDLVNKYFYSDGYFIDSPYSYNEHLASFGLSLAMAAGGSNIGATTDYSYKFDNVKSMLQGIGCEDIFISDSYAVKPSDSSIGFAIGRKTIKDIKTAQSYTLIPIAVRGFGYEKEWAGNVTINGENTKGIENAEHSGFKDARTKVLNEIDAYIAKNDLGGELKAGKIKFFLTGYSRAGATANLTGKALVDRYGSLSNYKNSVYAYCYEAPAGATDNEDKSLKSDSRAYYCIHNVINSVDLTPMVAFEEMGFKRYGVDHYVPGGMAGDVKTRLGSASKENGSYKVTRFYDNDIWYTDSDAYYLQKKNMLKQLMLVNDERYFIDYFKEAQMNLGKAHSIGQFIKGLVTYIESDNVKISEVKSSSKTIEQWLPEFYRTIQGYNTLGANIKLTRNDYSNTKVTAGKPGKDLGNGEKNWSDKGATAQDTFRSLFMMLLSKTPSEMEELGLSVVGIKNKLGIFDMLDIFTDLINSKLGWDNGGSIQQKYLDLLWNNLNDNKGGQKALRDAIKDKREYEAFENTFPTLISMAMRIVHQDYKQEGHESSLRLLGTLAHNSEAIIQGHMPEITFAWVRSYDSYYNDENTAYRWDAENDPGDQSVIVTRKTTNDGQSYLTLDAGKDREIFYQLYKPGTAENKIITKHYNDGEKLKLDSSKGVSEEYKLKTWTYRSFAKEAGKISWVKGEEKEESITVAPDKFIVTVNAKYGSRAGIDSSKTETIEVTKGGQAYLDEYKFRAEGYHFVGWLQEGADSYFSKEPKKKITVNENTTYTAVFMPLVTKAVVDWNVYTAIKEELEKGNFTNQLKYQELRLYFAPDEKIFEGVDAPISWYKYQEDHYVKADQNAKVENNTKYRAWVVIPGFLPADKEVRELSYAKNFKVTDQNGKEVGFEFTNGELRFSFEFEPVSDKRIESASMDITPDISINNGTKDQVFAKLKSVLPTEACTVKGNDGVTDKNVRVSWNYDSFMKDGGLEYADYATGRYYIRCNVDKTDLKNLKAYQWPDNLPVEKILYLNVLSAKKCSPPIPSPLANPSEDYYIVGYDDEVEEEKGKLFVTLTDPNENPGEIRYSLTGGSIDLSERPYSGAIELPYPAKGEKVNYIIKAKCVTDKAGYESSEELTYNYNIYNPTEESLPLINEYSVPELFIKINQGSRDAVMGKIKAVLPAEICTVTGNDGKTDRNVRVKWNYDKFNSEEGSAYTDNATGIYVIEGEVDKSDLKELKAYSWMDKTGLVTQRIEIIKAEKCAPPVAFPLSNTGDDAYIVGSHEETAAGAGRLNVELRNSNDCKSEIIYSVSGGSLNISDEVYKSAIKLPYPDAEEQKVSYEITAKVVAKSEGYANSEEVTFTYNIENSLPVAVNVLSEDYNDLSEPDEITGDMYERRIYTENNKEILLDASDLYDENTRHFVKWEILKGDKFETYSYDRSFTYTVDSEPTFRVVTVPLISSLIIGLDAPITGEGLPDMANSLYMTIGGEKLEIDPICTDLTWAVADPSGACDLVENEAARANTKYKSFIKIDLEEGLNYLEKEEDEDGDEYYGSEYLGDKFFLDPNIEIEIDNGKTESSPEDWDYGIDDEELLLDIDFSQSYDETEAATFIGVYPPEGLEISWNSDNSSRRFDDMMEKLPKVTSIMVDDDSINTAEIKWDTELSDGDKKGVAYEYMSDLVTKEEINGSEDWALNLMAYVVIPKELDYDEEDTSVKKVGDEVRYYFDYPVYLEGAPVSSKPEIYPESGEFDRDEDLMLKFITDKDNASIYYRVDELEWSEEGSPMIVYDSPVYYDENGKLVITEGTVKVGDQDYDHIKGEDYENGAIVTAVTLEEDHRVSDPQIACYYFHEKPEAPVSTEDLEAVLSLTLKSGGRLSDLTSSLPEGFSWDPGEDINEIIEEKAGEEINVYVIYNPDPTIYRDQIFDIDIEITAGSYEVFVENGKAYYGSEEIEDAEAGWTVTLKADEALEGMEFDSWELFTSDGQMPGLTYDPSDTKSASFTMPEADVYAFASFIEKGAEREEDSVESLTLDKTSIDLSLKGSGTLTASPVYKSGASDKPEVSFRSSDPSVVSVSPAKGNSVTLKGIKSGRANIWAVCGYKTIGCEVTVGENSFTVNITGGKASLADGSDVSNSELLRGTVITLCADSIKNEAETFKEWESDANCFDKTKAESTFSVTSDIIATALYKEAEGFEDAGDYTEASKKVKSLKLTDKTNNKSIKSFNMGLNESVYLDAKAVYISDKPAIVLRSSNTDVVKVKTVSSGEGQASATIVGCRTGSSLVTAYCGNKTVKFTVNVGAEEIGGLNISSGRIESTEDSDTGYRFRLDLKSGEQELLEVLPENPDSLAEVKYSWKSDDNKVATVKDGLVTAKSTEKGRTTITVGGKVRHPGEKVWAELTPVKIALNVEGISTPKNSSSDKSYSIKIKNSVKLDLNAKRIARKNVINEYDVVASVKGSPKDLSWSTTNSDIVAIDSSTVSGNITAHIRGVGIGTAYIVLTGRDQENKDLVNTAVMKVTVISDSPEVTIVSDTLDKLDSETNTLTLKAGDYDRLFVSVNNEASDYSGNTTEKIKWSAKGGLKITQDGLLYANKATKEGKPAELTVKCGKTSSVLKVIVK